LFQFAQKSLYIHISTIYTFIYVTTYYCLFNGHHPIFLTRRKKRALNNNKQ